MRFMVQSERSMLTGWRGFWAKTVDAFDPSVHCQKCLVGERLWPCSMKSPVNENVELSGLKTGTLVYFCGVASSWRWVDNAHLVVEVTNDEEHAAIDLWNGDRLVVVGGKRVPFDGNVARQNYPNLGKEFLTCRNFQFGAEMQADGRIPFGKEAPYRRAAKPALRYNGLRL